jgi:tetratricopeptide (TPR) repeat protein
MLNPPVSVARADFSLSGVGNAVQVRQIAPEAQGSVSLGYNALLHGEYDTALGFYKKALEREPTSVLALLGCGSALQKLHRLEEAQECYTKALQVDPQDREALTNITSIIAERAPAEALNRLLDLEKQYPAFSPIKAQIGLLYAKAGAMDQALDYLRHAIALSPESVMYQYNLALVLDHMKLPEQAVSAYERVLSAISLGQAPPELSSNQIERRVRFLRAR